jgi:hypothetical protein
MAPRNLSSDNSIVPSKLRLRLGGINSSPVDAAIAKAWRIPIGMYYYKIRQPGESALAHIGPVDANSHHGTLGVLDIHIWKQQNMELHGTA